MTWIICKICGQKADWFYWLLKDKMCVSCDAGIDRKLHPVVLTKEWKKHNEISEKAVEKYFSEQSRKGKIK